jgi:dienelactone hydrolase
VPRDALLGEIRDRRAAGADRIGLIGFSAGGHLAGLAALAPGAGSAGSVQFAVLGYSITSMETETYRPSRLILLGEDASPEARRSASLDALVTPQSPPFFLWHTAEDIYVPPEHTYRPTVSAWLKALGTRRPGPRWPRRGYANTPEPPAARNAVRPRLRGFRYLEFSVSFPRADVQQLHWRDLHDCVSVRGRADEPAHGR